MKTLLASGKTIEDAIHSGLYQLGVSQDRVKITVLEQPSRGFLGFIGTRDAKVNLTLLSDGIDTAIQFLYDVVEQMQLSVTVERTDKKDAVWLNLNSKDLGSLIGRRGQTLDSLQYLMNIVANRHSSQHLRIILDAAHFRERRQHTLETLAERMATKVGHTKKDVILEPMTSRERKIIHTHLQDSKDTSTYSIGEEPNRRIVITLRKEFSK